MIIEDQQIQPIHRSVAIEIPRALLRRVRAVAPMLHEDVGVQVIDDLVAVEVPRAKRSWTFTP
jgi:hypothetical protein